MAEQRFNAGVGGDATVERIVQAGVYNEAFRPLAEAAFPQFVAVPDRNPLFVGRGDELGELDRRCGGDEPVVIAQAAVGLGGVGKTALAVEFCHRRRGRTDVIRWLNAENRQTLVSELLRMGPALGVDTHGLEIDDAIARIRGWFETTERRWLLVFDNAETPAVLAQLVPRQGRGVVLVTSRYQDWSATGMSPLRLGVLDRADAVGLLCKAAGREPSAAAEELVDHLGCLALAVEQAGAFVRQTGWDFGRYQRLLEQRAAELLARNAAGLDARNRQDLSVLTVWDASLERASAEAEGAGAVLGVLGYVAADFLPRALLGAPAAAEEQSLRGGDELYIDEAIAALARYSLVEASRDPQTGETLTLSVHRLVQEVTRPRHREHGEADRWCGLAVRLLRRSFPAETTERDAWGAAQLLEPHVLTTTGYALAADCEPTAASWLLDRYGTYLQYSGNPLAPTILDQALRITERLLGEQHPDTLTARHNLAGSYWSAGRLPEAIALQERVLADRERLLGEQHPDTLTARANLAGFYWSAGRLPEAIALEERVLADGERLLGEQHPDTLTARANLAGFYWSAGRLPEAITLHERVLTDRERLLGEQHPDTLTARNNLATSYCSAGRLPEAIALEEQVLTDRERLLGEQHPDTLTARANLAGSYRSAGRLPEAITLQERVLTDAERVLGPQHPDTLRARGDLANSYRWAGRVPEAITLQERVLTDRERLLGEQHPATLTARGNLAGSYHSAGRVPEAIDLGERALTDAERVLGPEHPDTLTIRANLEASRSGREALAEPGGSRVGRLLRKALRQR